MNLTRHATLIPAESVVDPKDADSIHRQTMSLYASAELPGEPGARRSGANILWRHEPAGVLVTADLPPTDVPAGARTFVLDQSFATGERVAFTVTFDAIARVRGRDIPVADVGEWFFRKIGAAFAEVRVTSYTAFAVRRRHAPLDQVTFAGTAIVNDESALATLLRAGVGRSKTFGCGMLTVSPT